VVVSTASEAFFRVQLPELGKKVQVERWFTRDSIAKIDEVYAASDDPTGRPKQDKDVDNMQMSIPKRPLKPKSTCRVIIEDPGQDDSSSDPDQGEESV